MQDPRLKQLAEVLVRHSTKVKKGDLVTIVGEPTCVGPVEAIFEAVLKAGGHPSFHPRGEGLTEVLLKHGDEDQLRHVCPFEEFRLSRCDVLVVLICHTNTKYLGKVDPARAVLAQSARRGLITMSLRRKAAGETRYVAAEIPTNAAAQDAQMSLREYEESVFRAGLLHLPDPVKAWGVLQAQQERMREYLEKRSTLRFQVPACDGVGGVARHDGTDLTVDVSGRRWINCAGEENFPDGEVYTGPRGVDGVVNFTNPAVYRGKEVEGMRLRFKAGRVVEASASKNEDYLIALLDQDAGARTAGEIALGTNYEITEFARNTFLDEKIGGTFHVAVGAGYPETGNANESALHWDMVCDLRQGGTVEADGVRIAQNGRFLIEGWPGTGG